MKKTKPSSPASEPINYLDEVRQGLTKVPRADFQRIAADSGLHLRTLYALLENPNRDPNYSTVHKLYCTLANSPTTERRKTP